jgi:hypothetical protein
MFACSEWGCREKAAGTYSQVCVHVCLLCVCICLCFSLPVPVCVYLGVYECACEVLCVLVSHMFCVRP